METLNEKELEMVVGSTKMVFPCMKQFRCDACGNTGVLKVTELGELTDFLSRGCSKCHNVVALHLVC